MGSTLWICFFLHDVGYFGKENLEGDTGITHPALGAKIIGFLFGEKWKQFCLCHSRSYSKKFKHPLSKLCYADKLSILLEPSWLYLPRIVFTGEINEYINKALKDIYNTELDDPFFIYHIQTCSASGFHVALCHSIKNWLNSNFNYNHSINTF